MTLIAATVAPHAAWISSDTMLFDDDGRPAFQVFKLLELPSAHAVAAVTGPLELGCRLYDELRRDRPASLEAALVRAQERLVEVSRLMPDEPLELVVVGWSELRGRAEGWVLSMADPVPIQTGESYHRPLPEPTSRADCDRLGELAVAACEGGRVPEYHLGCARVIARQPGDFAGGTLWTAETTAAGITLHRMGELPC